MNLLLLDDAEIADGRAVVDDRRAEHLLRVLKVEVGQEIRAGRIGGRAGQARVSAIRGPAVELELEIPSGKAERPTVDLVIGLPRPQALKRILQYSATLGVGHIDLIKAWRVEKSYFHSPLLKPAALRRHLLLGAEQGMCTWLPEVRLERRFTSYVRELAAGPAAPLSPRGDQGGETLCLVAHPEAADAIEAVAGELAADPRRRVKIAFGPEGGFIDREVESLATAGFRPVSLGPWILRVETALAAALAQLELLRRLAES